MSGRFVTTTPSSSSANLSNSASRQKDDLSSSQQESAQKAPPPQWAAECFKVLSILLSTNVAGNMESLRARRIGGKNSISMLPMVQLQELSQDVNEEVVRRQAKPPPGPFLPLRTEYNTRRNQVRQKLGTLPPARFRELAADVYFELDERFVFVHPDTYASSSGSQRQAGLPPPTPLKQSPNDLAKQKNEQNLQTPASLPQTAPLSNDRSQRSQEAKSSGSSSQPEASGQRKGSSSNDSSSNYQTPTRMLNSSSLKQAAQNPSDLPTASRLSASLEMILNEIKSASSELEHQRPVTEEIFDPSPCASPTTKIRALSAQIQNLEDCLQKKVAVMQATEDALNSKIKALESEKTAQERYILTLNENMKTLSAQLSESQRQASSAQSEVTILTASLRASEANCESLRVSVAAAEDRARTLQAQFAELKNAIGDPKILSSQDSSGNTSTSKSSSSTSTTAPRSISNSNISSQDARSGAKGTIKEETVATNNEQGEQYKNDSIQQYESAVSFFLTTFKKGSKSEIIEAIKLLFAVCKKIIEKLDQLISAGQLSESLRESGQEHRKTVFTSIGRLMEAAKAFSQGSQDDQSSAGSSNVELYADMLTRSMRVIIDIVSRFANSQSEQKPDASERTRPSQQDAGQSGVPSLPGWSREAIQQHLKTNSTRIVGQIQIILGYLKEKNFGSEFESVVYNLNKEISMIIAPCRDLENPETRDPSISAETWRTASKIIDALMQLCEDLKRVTKEISSRGTSQPDDKASTNAMATCLYQIATNVRDLQAAL